MTKPSGASVAGSLFLSPEAPFPPVGGGALRSASLLAYLAQRSSVDRILFRQPGVEDPSTAIPSEYSGENCVIPLPYHRTDSFSKLTRNTMRVLKGQAALVDRFAGFSRQMETFLKSRRYDLGVIEHFWCAPYLEVLKKHCQEVWLDLHNIESVLQERSAQVSGGFTGAGYRRFAEIYRRLEGELFPRFDRILTTSSEDAALVHEIAPSAQVIVFPNTIPEQPRPERVEENIIVFSGNFAYPPNLEAVRFFSEKIWPRLQQRAPGLVWRLIGRNPEAIARFVHGEKYIEVKGPVQDAILELARAKVAVVPVRSGSGTRVKILEAWAAATPVVSTTLGAEGLLAQNGEHLLVADNVDCFVETVCKCLASQSLRARIGEAGRKLYEERYTWREGWRQLDQALFQ